jgi:hypothetical protein
MSRFVRDLFVGNWRNKGVALFFALTIWFVAYQSELRDEDAAIVVTLRARQPEQMIILAEQLNSDSGRVSFAGTLNVKVRGTRKQIDAFRDSIRARVPVLIDAPLQERKEDETPGGKGTVRSLRYTFQIENLSIDDPAVEIVSFEPSFVDLVFDERAEMRLPVSAVYSVREGWEKDFELIEPQSVQVSGPRSKLEDIALIAEAPAVISRERFEKLVPIQIRAKTGDESAVRAVFSFLQESEVKLTVQLKIKQDRLSAEALPVRFVLPALEYPMRIVFDEASVPVHFLGPEAEIQRLRERIARDPGFYVAVEVPAFSLSPEREQLFTFTEDKLLIPGFTRDIQRLQHEKRQGKGAWQCTIIPVRPDREKEKE